MLKLWVDTVTAASGSVEIEVSHVTSPRISSNTIIQPMCKLYAVSKGAAVVCQLCLGHKPVLQSSDSEHCDVAAENSTLHAYVLIYRSPCRIHPMSCPPELFATGLH